MLSISSSPLSHRRKRRDSFSCPSPVPPKLQKMMQSTGHSSIGSNLKRTTSFIALPSLINTEPLIRAQNHEKRTKRRKTTDSAPPESRQQHAYVLPQSTRAFAPRPSSPLSPTYMKSYATSSGPSVNRPRGRTEPNLYKLALLRASPSRDMLLILGAHVAMAMHKREQRLEDDWDIVMDVVP